jgi:hypothetical protein
MIEKKHMLVKRKNTFISEHMKKNYKELAKQYFEEYNKLPHDFYDLDKIIENILLDPMEGLILVEAFVNEAQNDTDLAYFAAGHFENFYSSHYKEIANTLNELVRTNAKMRKAITGIWLPDGSDAKKNLEKLLAHYDLKYASL